jgi:hypothetical protein
MGLCNFFQLRLHSTVILTISYRFDIDLSHGNHSQLTIMQNYQRKEQQGATTAARSHIVGLWLTHDFWQWMIGHQRRLCRDMSKRLRESRILDITKTGPCDGLFGDFWQKLKGCRKQMSQKLVQVAEIVRDLTIVLYIRICTAVSTTELNLIMTLH